MGFFNKIRTDGATFDGQGSERRGFIDVIQYNGNKDELVWKFPYNNISTGAKLIVNRSQEAVFVKGGAVCDIFGEGTHTLSSGELPLLGKIINLPYGGRTPFTAEVWFVNKVVRRGLKFGTPQPINVVDPRYAGAEMTIPVRANGDYSIRVVDSQLLLNEFVGTQHLLTTDEFVKHFFSMVVQELNRSIKRCSREKNISPLDFPEYAPEIADFIKEILAPKFEIYGISLEDFQFSLLAPNYDDPSVKGLYDKRRNAISEAEQRNIQGITYQQERQLDILEQAVANEGSINSSMMGTGVGMSMGVGMGRILAGQMQQMAQTFNSPQAPPPPPVMQASPYYVYVNGNQQGPFDMNTLGTLVQTGMLKADTLVWRQGMAQWAPAGQQPDLFTLFNSATPPPPPPIM